MYILSEKKQIFHFSFVSVLKGVLDSLGAGDFAVWSVKEAKKLCPWIGFFKFWNKSKN